MAINKRLRPADVQGAGRDEAAIKRGKKYKIPFIPELWEVLSVFVFVLLGLQAN